MTEAEARQAIDQAQDVLAKLGYKTYLLEVHVPTVMEELSENPASTRKKRKAIDECFEEFTHSWDSDCNDMAEYVEQDHL